MNERERDRLIAGVKIVSAILRWPTEEVYKKVEEYREKEKRREVEEYLKDESAFVRPEIYSNLIEQYYGPCSSDEDVKRYVLRVADTNIATTIYTKDQFVGLASRLGCKPEDSHGELVNSVSTPPLEDESAEHIKAYAPKIIERLERMGVKIWDAPLYRILEDEIAGKIYFRFAETRFLAYRYTAGLLEDELTDALIEKQGDVSRVLDEKGRVLKIRQDLLPDIGSFTDYDSRLCCGGIGVVFALARGEEFGNDFVVPLQIRSAKVSDGRGRLAVLPKAFHQPVVGDDAEANLFWTVFRELYEEVFGGSEVEKEITRLKYDWYVDECPPVRFFWEHDNVFNLEVTGYGINAVGGNYDVAILLAVKDTWYWDTYGKEMCKSWESGTTLLVSTKNRQQIERLLTEGQWASESLFQFVEGILRLRQIDQTRVDLPDLERTLG